MKTITVNLYEFSELSEEGKQQAIEKLSDINVSYDWWQFTYEDSENIGLKITGFGLDRDRHADGKFTLSAAEVAANIIRDHGEMCETFKTAQTFLNEFNPVFANYLDERHKDYESSESEQTMLDMEDQFLTSLLEDYSIMLQQEYEYQTSEEAIIETIEANGYTFEANGTLNNG